MRAGIVGSGEDKFTPEGKREALNIIDSIMEEADVLVSGHSPIGGIDIWAEESARLYAVQLDLKVPEIHQWNPDGYGYKARNLDIAEDSDYLHVIVVDQYPEEYSGMRFDLCYHCNSTDHVKSGGCWTGKKALLMGKPVTWHIVENYPSD